MPLIAPQLESDRQVLSFKVDVRLLASAEAVHRVHRESPRTTSTSQALLVTFAKDTHFHGWLQQKAPDDLAHLRALLAERHGATSGPRDRQSRGEGE